jgi:hypothetical protein
MALGDRILKVTKVHIFRNDPVDAIVDWELYIQAAVVGQILVQLGQVPFSLGAQSSALNLTLLQIRNQAVTAVTNAHTNGLYGIPDYDTIT